MTTPQLAAFWAWWKTGLEGSGKRSFRKTAKATGHSLRDICAWADEEGWSELASQKDMELQSKLEDTIFKRLIDDNAEIVTRQRQLITKVYEEILLALPGMKVTLDQVLKLMEYERTLDDKQRDRNGSGSSLKLILELVTPEARSDIFRAIGDARRDGAGLFDR